MESIGIIGGGAWGTALAQSFAGAGKKCILWAREAEVVSTINTRRENAMFLPGVTLHENIRATDSIGDAAVNQRLSLRRAEVVAREMETRGFPAAGLQARGLGATRPIADNATEAGRTQNRRVAVIVLSD